MDESVTLVAKADELNAIHAALERFWLGLSGSVHAAPGRDWQLLFTMAVVEIAANIMRHAYPAEVGTFRLRLYSVVDAAHACFADTGIEFVEADTARQDTSDDDALAESGFGLSIARRCLDGLQYRRSADGINSWHLVKRFGDKGVGTRAS